MKPFELRLATAFLARALECPCPQLVPRSGAAGALVASHDRLTDRGQIRYDWQHYIALVERNPGALRNGAPFADMPVLLKQLLTH